MRLQCGGEPDATVWRDWTALDIANHFKRDKFYSVHTVAGELGISYDQAYKYIIPWMKAHGFRVG